MFGPRCLYSIQRLYCQKVSCNVHDNMSMGDRKYTKSDQPVSKDSFGRHHNYLRILTERCNLRCDYCTPENGITLTFKQHLLKPYEILQLAKLFVKQGVRKIRSTGGEPTVHKDLKFIIENLTSMNGVETVAMTTNGFIFTRCLSDLNTLNISFDTLQEHKFETVTSRKGFSKVIKGIDYALELNYNPVKVRQFIPFFTTTCFNQHFVELTRERNIHARFIEYMPFRKNKWHTTKMVIYAELLSVIRQKYPDFRAVNSDFNEISKLYTVPGFAGLGFISSISDNFCGACNRLRLLADGSLKVCLVGSAEISLRDALRNGCSEDDILALIRAAVMRKKKQHAGFCESNTSKLLFRIPIHHTKSMQVQCYSTLSHVNCSGKATMIDVGSKEISSRFASAYAEVHIGFRIVQMIRDNEMKKGDVLSVAKLAGIMAAKNTSSLIPLCHTIALSFVGVQLEIADQCIIIISKVRCSGQTGVEMEALTAVTVAALTIYDMCKVVSHDIIIQNVRLLEKTGGKHKFVTKVE